MINNTPYDTKWLLTLFDLNAKLNWTPKVVIGIYLKSDYTDMRKWCKKNCKKRFYIYF